MFRNAGSVHEIEITRSLSPLTVWALSQGCAVGWGAFMMPGTTFLPLAGPLGALIGLMIGAVIMLIIGVNYYYMINHFPDAGGSYAFASRTLGHDHGFLCAWFLALVYISIVWANATALPLIFRNLWGDIFQFGFHYQIAGYDVYFGEAMLSLAAIFFFSFLCSRGSKLAGRVQLICALVLVGGISIGLLAAVFRGQMTSSSIQPYFSPSKSPLTGVFNVVALAPWAFCGFESVSNAAEEYDVLLIDHRMPVMDGIEMLKTLRGLSDNPNSKKPCICLTANAVAGAKEEYMKAGFDDYMKKPVNGRRIEQMLINYLPREKVDVGHAPEQEVEGTAAPTAPFYHLKDAGINANEGIEYAGTKDMYVMALQFFRDTLDEKSAEIDGYYESRDWTNYITKVHGLKSSARVIGADELSEHARMLEIAGKNEDFASIHENHAALLEEYGTFKEILKRHLRSKKMAAKSGHLFSSRFIRDSIE